MGQDRGHKSLEVPNLQQLARTTTDKITRQPHDAAGAEDDESGPTAQYHPAVESRGPAVSVGAADEVLETSLYHPSVASLLSKLTAPEVAALTRSDTDENRTLMQRLTEDLRQALDHLRLHKVPEDLHHDEALEGARRRCKEVTEILDDPASEPASSDDRQATARDELLGIYFELQRLVETCAADRARAPAAKATPARSAAAKAPAAAAVVELPAVRPRSRRAALLGLLVALIAVARLGLFVYDQLQDRNRPDVEQLTEPGDEAVETVKRRIVQRADGPPLILSVTLARAESGAVTADAVVLDPGDCVARVTYRWFMDGTLQGETSGPLPADQIKAGASYSVEARARCGRQISEPLRSGELKVQ